MSDATLTRLIRPTRYDNSMNCMLFVGLTVVAHQAILLFTQYSLREIPIIASSMVYQ